MLIGKKRWWTEKKTITQNGKRKCNEKWWSAYGTECVCLSNEIFILLFIFFSIQFSIENGRNGLTSPI